MRAGQKHSDEARRKISEKAKMQKPTFLGKKHSEESRKKMSEAKWKGNNIGRQHKHRRIEQWFGKPSYCEICKRTDRKRYDWANTDHKYILDKKYWMRLCRGCHVKYDNKFNRVKK